MINIRNVLIKLSSAFSIILLSAHIAYAIDNDCFANQFSSLDRPSIQGIQTANDFFQWRSYLHFSEASIAKIPLAKRAPLKGPRSIAGFDIDDRAWQYDFLSTLWSEGGCGFYQKTTEQRSANDVYNFKFWQYLDITYYFGHQLLVIPPIMWTNAAHKNGVVSLGTFNLNDVDLNSILDQNHLTATIQNLADVAKTIGFDGYVINLENYAFSYRSAILTLMSELKQKGLTIIWYDAPLSGGYANYLNNEAIPFLINAGYFQSNYAWDVSEHLPEKSYQTLQENHLENLQDNVFQAGDAYRNAYKNDPFEKCIPQSYNNLFSRFKEIFADDSQQNYYTGLGFYAPNWTMFGGKKPNPELDTGVPSTQDFEQSDAAFWEGSGDYGCGSNDFSQASFFIKPRTTIIRLPFYSNFNTGVGEKFVSDGKVISLGPWSNFTIQSILPTWQNEPIARTTAKAFFDYQNVFQGGSSWKVEDNNMLSTSAIFKFYSTNFKTTDHTQIDLWVKTASNESIQLKINRTQNLFPLVKKNKINDWQKFTFNLPANITVQEIDIAIQPDKNGTINVNVGSIKIFDPSSLPIPQNQIPSLKDNIISWSWKNPGSSYRIFGKKPDSSWVLLNEVVNNTYNLHGNIFNGKENTFSGFLIQEVTVAGDSLPI